MNQASLPSPWVRLDSFRRKVNPHDHCIERVPGRHNCIGKNLAMMQMRSVVARLVCDFDVAFAPHEDGVAVWRDLKDQFNSHPGKLELVFAPRRCTSDGK